MVKKDFIARLYVILQYMQQTIKEKCPREGFYPLFIIL